MLATHNQVQIRYYDLDTLLYEQSVATPTGPLLGCTRSPSPRDASVSCICTRLSVRTTRSRFFGIKRTSNTGYARGYDWSSTLNTLRNHGGNNQDYYGIIKCTSRTFNDVCGETCLRPGMLAIYLRARTPAASSPKKHLPPPHKNSICLPSHRCGSKDVKGWSERDGGRPSGQLVGRFKAGKEGAEGGFSEGSICGGMLPSKGCAGYIAIQR